MTDTSTETTVSDPDEFEVEVDEPEVDTEPDWLVIASLCDCNYVAMSIMHPDCVDTHAPIEPEHDDEAVAYGADWQALVAPLAVTMAERSGQPISAMCTSVYLPRADILQPTEQEQAAQQAIVDEVYAITNRMPLPCGVRVRGRYDFCGSKHPGRDDTFCRRGADHDGDHSAYTYRITVPETWPSVQVPVELDDGDEEGLAVTPADCNDLDRP